MFSGLTNQVSSWMGSSKAEQHEDKEPTPVDDGIVNAKKDTSPTKISQLDMLSNVKTQIEGISGWLGPCIPKLHKEDAEVNPNLENECGTPATTESVKGFPQKKDDNGNSSPTCEADSRPQSATKTHPTEQQKDQFRNVQCKAIASAKSFGSFLFSAVHKAGKTINEAGANIKKTIEENSLLGQFNKEQESFLKFQSVNTTIALPPWIGCPNEETLKQACLSMSIDQLNFMRSPPAGVDFQFDYETSYPVAMAILEEDPNLEKMRYKLVPKVISEENFWRNYFYRVSLICRVNELSFISREDDSQSVTSEQQIDSKVKEFVSDCTMASSQDVSEVQEGMKRLTMESKRQEREWEKELEAELQDYEEVGEQKINWEQEIKMLEDEADLK